MEKYEEQIDAYSKFYSNFAQTVNIDTANEIYNESILNSADNNDWNNGWLNKDDTEYDTEVEWYNSAKKKLKYEAEEECIEEIIRRVFEDAGINVNRLSADDFEDFQDYIKEKFTFLDASIDDET